uniref:Fibronectin type-III domain-containing protein n=1 Tax=Mola mola TaxID=94237 RepID=A0A3Q3WK37_MOLML
YCIKGTAWDSEGQAGDDLTVCQITPPSPDVVHIQMTQGRSLEVAVYWAAVQGAENYIALTTNGQNCTSALQSYCFIPSVQCGQNHSVSVIAINKAGPSSPSQPANYITPCPPESIWVEEPKAGKCSVVWDEEPMVEYYIAFIKRDDGTEKSCNTSETTCPFYCTC